MSINFIIIILYYFLIIASTLGFGYLTKNLLIGKNINLDYGFTGLAGIFFFNFLLLPFTFFYSP